MSGRIWQLRYHDERADRALAMLDASPKDREGRSIVVCGGAEAVWRADALREDAGLRVTLWPVDPHDVNPTLELRALPMPTEVIDA